MMMIDTSRSFWIESGHEVHVCGAGLVRALYWLVEGREVHAGIRWSSDDKDGRYFADVFAAANLVSCESWPRSFGDLAGAKAAVESWMREHNEWID